MIYMLTNTSLSQKCECCSCERTFEYNLIVGSAMDSQIIKLPVCECGAQEFLNRTFDNPGTHAHMVNSLHWHLERNGQVHEHVKEKLASEKKKPTNKCTLTEKACTCFEDGFDPSVGD